MAGIPEPKSTTPVTANQLEAFATDLLDFAQKLQLAAKVARTQQEESIAVYNWASGLNGIKALRGFVTRVDESRSASELGRPLLVGELKPRSTAKKSSLDVAKQAKAVKDQTFRKTKKKGTNE